ncbi:MAG: ribosomal protein L31E [halophilic archaeon J07HX5]|jgi:LSU ribosomal protein L31E|nr:MAG: ribosomal protein L31E [halophilic archaeon J07HX5]
MSADGFEERVVTVPLRDARTAPKSERADAAMSIVRDHLATQFSVSGSAVQLDASINEAVWANGRKNPPSSLRVRAARFEDDNVVEAELAD